MEHYEPNDYQQSAADSPAVSEETAPRKASPFADSPYMMHSDPAPEAAPAAEHPVEKKRGKKGFKRLLAAVLVIALVAAGCSATAFAMNRYWNTAASTLTQQMNQQIADLNAQIQDLEQQIHDNSYTGNGNSVSGTPNVGFDGSLTPAQVYAQNVKCVVAIANQTAQGGNSGSGFIISADGYIVSNYHVVADSVSLTVTAWDGAEYSANYIGGDELHDIALLKIEAAGLQAAQLGSSDDLIVGDQVVAIGNPLGTLTSSLTVGYVSAKDKDVNTSGAAISMIQTDAAINPGNSGGPLFNMKGEVVGITSAKYSGITSSGATIEGIGFAIPVDDVLPKLEDLRNYGYITGAYLGVMVSDTDASLSYYGIPAGALVREVTPGFCAEEAGIRAKDIIIAVGEHNVGGLNDLTRALQNFKAGDKTTVTVWRAGQTLSLPITLDEKPVENNP